nr:MAG: GxxExxY protein [Chloroflexota bacterium]
MTTMTEQQLTRLISDAAAKVHEALGGPGLELPPYRDALAYELRQRGLAVEKRTIPPGKYPGVTITRAEPIDMIVNDLVIVEPKVDWKPQYEAEALAHLRMTGLKQALIINFGAHTMRNAIRIVKSGI